MQEPMKKNIFLALPLILTSCATPTPPPVAFHKTDSTMLVIRSLDVHTCQILQPTTTTEEETAKFLEQAKSLKQRQTAVVILEKYTDSSIGNQFRDRGTDCEGWDTNIFIFSKEETWPTLKDC